MPTRGFEQLINVNTPFTKYKFIRLKYETIKLKSSIVKKHNEKGLHLVYSCTGT